MRDVNEEAEFIDKCGSALFSDCISVPENSPESTAVGAPQQALDPDAHVTCESSVPDFGFASLHEDLNYGGNTKQLTDAGSITGTCRSLSSLGLASLKSVRVQCGIMYEIFSDASCSGVAENIFKNAPKTTPRHPPSTPEAGRQILIFCFYVF